MYKYLNIVFLTILLLLSVSACMSTTHRARMTSQSPDPAVRVSAMTAKLRQQGVQIIEVGETVSIIIPSDPLFQGASANLDRSSFYRLNSIVDFLRLYPKTFVEVAGYTDFSGDRDKLLTSQQAAQVVHYLWSKGIDSRMLNAVGYGSDRPIVNSDLLSGNTKNRRIEIHFQYDKY